MKMDLNNTNQQVEERRVETPPANPLDGMPAKWQQPTFKGATEEKEAPQSMMPDRDTEDWKLPDFGGSATPVETADSDGTEDWKLPDFGLYQSDGTEDWKLPNFGIERNTSPRPERSQTDMGYEDIYENDKGLDYKLPFSSQDLSQGGWGNPDLNAQNATKGTGVLKAEYDVLDTNSTTYPNSLYKSELGGNEHLAIKLHGGGMDTIAYGLDLNDSNNYKYLKAAGVSAKVIVKLKARSTKARITEAQAKSASDLAYQAKYKQLSGYAVRHGLPKLDDMQPEMRTLAVNLGYNGYWVDRPRKANSPLSQFRADIWGYFEAGDMKGLLKYVKNSKFRKGVVGKRFVRAGFLQ